MLASARNAVKESTAGFGVTSVDNSLPVDADTLFQIGSTTKTFTDAAAMRLVEQGKLDLDVPIRTYLPNLRTAGAGVAERLTLCHLFTHTGGWFGDYFNDFGWGDDALAHMVEQVAELPQLTLRGGFPLPDSPPRPSPPPTRLALCGDDDLLALDPPMKGAHVEFLRHSDGSIAWLRFGGRIRKRES